MRNHVKISTAVLIGLLAGTSLTSAEESQGSSIPGAAKSEPPRSDTSIDKRSSGDTGGLLKSEHGGDTTIDKSSSSDR